jgi:hypothetical protein
MTIKYTSSFHSKALQNLPKLGFWFENKQSGNPGGFQSKIVTASKPGKVLRLGKSEHAVRSL